MGKKLSNKEVNELVRFTRERDRAVRQSIEQNDLDIFRIFYARYAAKGYYQIPLPGDRILEITLRKMLYNIPGATNEEKEYAKAWLEARNLATDI